MMVRNLNLFKLKRKLRRNLLLENSQEKEKINPAIFKKNPTVRRTLHQEESSGQPCNQEAQHFQTP